MKSKTAGFTFAILSSDSQWRTRRESGPCPDFSVPIGKNWTKRIINWAWQGLEDTGVDESGATLPVDGGGSLAINPYYETVTLFGASSEYGPEEERETVARLFQDAFS